MAGSENRDVIKINKLDDNILNDLKTFIWGPRINEDVFRRWSQGFVFEDAEPTALVQNEGGPCAVIVPVQSFLLKNAIFKEEGDSWKNINTQDSSAHLVSAFKDILCQCHCNEFILLTLDNSGPIEDSSHDVVNTYVDECSKVIQNEKKSEDSFYHSQIRVISITSNVQLEHVLKENLHAFQGYFGVLLFLYSVLLTKGVEQIKNEMEDPNDSLIDPVHGHGSQSLINLLLTGRAVSNVWDNEKDVSGLKLQGIDSQPLIGFLTQLEHLRYCEVGWYLKCPQFPIWVLGSETHLTILFSKETSLCAPESPEAAARRIFKSFDPDGNNFIATVLLEDVLQKLGFVTEKEYVEMMKQKLDSENLGIILLNSFMGEFFPHETFNLPQAFTVEHYNGLRRSFPDKKVLYRKGKATMMDFEVKMYTENLPILTCLQTKWPGLEVDWEGGFPPSLD